MNVLTYIKRKINKKGISNEVVGIILLIVALAIFAVLYLTLSSQGKDTAEGLGAMKICWPWEPNC